MYQFELNISHARRGVELARQWARWVPELLGDAPVRPEVEELLADLARYARRSKDQRAAMTWRVAEAWLRVVRADHRLRELARTGAAGVGEERERLTVLIQEAVDLQGQLDDPSVVARLGELVDPATGRVRRDRAAAVLSGLPLPTVYLRVPTDTLKRRPPSGGSSTEPVPVLRLICDLDGTPLVSPQLLRPGPMYAMSFRVRGHRWPAGAERLRIRFLSTCPRDCYSVSEFELAKPAAAGKPFEGVAAGQLRFAAPQSGTGADLVFRAQCEFHAGDGRVVEAPVVGHHELRFRVSDRTPLGLQTPYRRLDAHVTELLERLVAGNPGAAAELPTLIPVLEALVGVVGTFAQGGMFKGKLKVSEKDFQREVVNFMRQQLGTEVQEHGVQAGGITDVRYRGVIVELKVEKVTGDRSKIADKYTAQPTQYAGSEARQVAIALVLDLTKKVHPPGDIRNDILLVDVPTHGGPEGAKLYPSKAFVFVVNGNTRNPSSYS